MASNPQPMDASTAQAVVDPETFSIRLRRDDERTTTSNTVDQNKWIVCAALGVSSGALEHKSALAQWPPRTHVRARKQCSSLLIHVCVFARSCR